MDEHADKARYFRKRAGELRADAADAQNEKARELLMERAQDCEQMAAGREVIAMAITNRLVAEQFAKANRQSNDDRLSRAIRIT